MNVTDFHKILFQLVFYCEKRLHRNEFSKYRLHLNFTDHRPAMSQRAIILKFANIVPALVIAILSLTFDH